MKTTTILPILAAALIFAGLFAWGYAGKGGTTASVQNAGGSSAGGMLAASESFYDFGAISMRNGNVTKEFTVTNPTNQDVTIKTMVTSCMCTVAFLVRPDGSAKGPFGMSGHGGAVPPVNEFVKAGESRTVRIVYDPNAHGPAGVGAVDRFIMLTDGSGNTLQLEIKAVVTP